MENLPQNNQNSAQTPASPQPQATQQAQPAASAPTKKFDPKKLLLISAGIMISVAVLLVIWIIISGAFANPGGDPEPDPTADPSETGEPEIKQTALEQDISKWQVFRSAEYGVSFSYPEMGTECCDIVGPSSPTARRIASFNDPTTSLRESGEIRYDSFAVYVDANTSELSLDDYVSAEISKQKELYKVSFGEEYRTGGILETLVAGPAASIAGKRVVNFAPDSIERYYFEFPENQKILIIAVSATEGNGFLNITKKIMSTLVFFTPETKACNNEGLGISSTIPDDWSCEIDLGNGKRDAVITTTIRSELFDIKINNDRPTKPCISEGKGYQPGCYFVDFYISPRFSLQKYELDGKNLEMFGLLKEAASNRDIYMYVKYSGISERDLTEEEKVELFMVLDSIALI